MKNPRKVKFDKPEHLAKLINKATREFYSYFPIEATKVCWIVPLCNSKPKTLSRVLVRIAFDVADGLVEYRKEVKEAMAGKRDWNNVKKLDLNKTHTVRVGVDEFGKVFIEDVTMKKRHEIASDPEAKWHGNW